jgi:hypothetical protein
MPVPIVASGRIRDGIHSSKLRLSSASAELASFEGHPQSGTLLKPEMISSYKRSANLLLLSGWILLTIGGFEASHSGSAAIGAAIALILTGATLFVYGCAKYARGKGHSPYWGAFGLLWLPGFIVLACLSDRHKPDLQSS